MDRVIVSVSDQSMIVINALLPVGSGQDQAWTQRIQQVSPASQIYCGLEGIIILVLPADVGKVIEALTQLATECGLTIAMTEQLRIANDGDLLT